MARNRKLKLALIDAHALIHRAYHALPPMSTKEGKPTNAVYGFLTMFLKMLSTLKPTHVVAAFDMAGPTFRHKAFPEYKAHRAGVDSELAAQFPLVREVLAAFNVPVLEKKSFEADDVLGTLVEKINGGVKKIIVTGDADALQLIDTDTQVFTLRRGITDTVTYGAAEVKAKYGFAPERLVDFKGLAGDASDNIPGVAGIGEKTARELVSTYGTIEEIYKNLEHLPKRAQTRLTGHKKEALLSRKLAIIRRDVPLEFSLADAELADFDAGEVRNIFVRLEFNSLLNKIPKSMRGETQPTLLKNLESGIKNKAQNDLPENYYLVESEAEQRKLREKLEKEKVIAFDTETDYLGARLEPIIGMSFATPTPSSSPSSLRQGFGRQAGRGRVQVWYVPVDRESVKKWKGLLESDKVGKVGHNLKYDIQVLRQSGIELKPIVFDSMVGSYLLNPGGRAHGLDALAASELGRHNIPISSLIGEGKEVAAMSSVPLTDMARYAGEDADVAWQLFEVFSKRLNELGQRRVLNEIELPLIAVLADIENRGVKLNKAALKKLAQESAARIKKLKKKIWAAAGEEFNINSTKQLRAVLYDKLKLPTVGIARTQSGFSTAASELDKLREEHKIIPLLEDFREVTKLKNTYIDTLPELIDEKTGRVHGSFNQTVAATGRLSSADPNLQNIPTRTELGQTIRAAFVAERGNSLVKADYSQLELRIAAHMARDEKMIEAFRAGQDIHAATAAWVANVAVEKVTPGQRRAAKALNFGVLYGMGAQKFAREANVSAEEARSFIERYWEQYQGLRRLKEETIQQAEELGFVETLWGRRLPIAEINARDPRVRAGAERAAFNFPIQGTEADILKKAMIDLHAALQKIAGAAMILTVHDELVCEAPEKAAKKVAQLMKDIMSSVITLDVPLTVEAAIGKNWKEMRPA